MILLLVALPAHAQMYKWVDDKGVTHYSAEPPPEGAKGAAKVELKTTPAAPAAAAKDDWKAKELQSRQRRAKEEMADEKTRAQEAAQRRERCVRAADALDTYRSQVPVYNFNERGEKYYIEDKDRPALIARAKADVEKYCDR